MVEKGDTVIVTPVGSKIKSATYCIVSGKSYTKGDKTLAIPIGSALTSATLVSFSTSAISAGDKVIVMPVGSALTGATWIVIKSYSGITPVPGEWDLCFGGWAYDPYYHISGSSAYTKNATWNKKDCSGGPYAGRGTWFIQPTSIITAQYNYWSCYAGTHFSTSVGAPTFKRLGFSWMGQATSSGLYTLDSNIELQLVIDYWGFSTTSVTIKKATLINQTTYLKENKTFNSLSRPIKNVAFHLRTYYFSGLAPRTFYFNNWAIQHVSWYD